jgi:hypothetical protein
MPKKGEKGGPGSEYYRAYLMRPGPQNLGTVQWPEPVDGALEGERFFSTGVLETIERDNKDGAHPNLVDLITGCGGIYMTVVSKKLTYLIVGREAGPKKLEKAQDLEIPIIDEGGFYTYITEKIANYDPTEVKPKIEEKEKKAKPRAKKVAVKKEPAAKKSTKKQQVAKKASAKVEADESQSEDVKPKIKKEAVKKEPAPKKLTKKRPAAKKSSRKVETDDESEPEDVKSVIKPTKRTNPKRSKLT